MTANRFKWRTIGEMIGLVAVVLSLVFVALELKQANQVANLDARRSLIVTLLEINMEIAANPELARVVSIASSGDAVEPNSADLHQVRHLTFALYNAWSLLDAAFESGQMSEENYVYWVAEVRASLERWPGMIPHFEVAMQSDMSVEGRSLEELFAFYSAAEGDSAYMAILEAVVNSN